MKNIHQTYTIGANTEAVWQALTNPKTIEQWGGGPAKMEPTVGTEFSLWGGEIYGKNITVEAPYTLIQEWYGGTWDKPSIVTFSLTAKSGKTVLDLHQTVVPQDEVDDIADGWKQYYFDPIKALLES